MTLPKTKAPTADTAYRELIDAIDDADADPTRRLASVLESKPFENFMARWIGVEATSLYVTHQSTGTTAELEFLHDVVGASAPPIFFCSPGKTTFCEAKRLEDVLAARLRTVQRQSLEGGLKGRDTSAALCARHLLGSVPGKPLHLLLHFAEILGYSFVYHLLDNDWNATDSTVARDHALVAWGKLCRPHTKRSGAAVDVVSKDLLRVLHGWYKRSPAQDVVYSRDFLGGRQIAAIYTINAPLESDLESCVQTPTDDAFGTFVTNWATALMLSLSGLGSANSDLKHLFWENTLINPRVEEAFLTRGLYVTIIRSPQMQPPRDAASADRLSPGYAICTVYDSTRLELEVYRRHLDVALRRIAHEDLVSYNVRTLQQTSEETENRLARTKYVQDQLRQLQDSTSNPDVGYEQLVVNAANTCHALANAVGVLIASPDLGVYSSWKASGDGSAKTLWCEAFSGARHAALDLAEELRAAEPDGYEGVHEIDTSTYAGKLKRIFDDVRTTEDCRYAAFLVETDPRGLMLLVFRGSEHVSTGEIRNVAEILAIGMAMSFRSTIGRGLLSLCAEAGWSVAAGVFGSPRSRGFFQRVRVNWGRGLGRGENRDADGRHRRSSFEWLKDLSVATIVEVTRAGLVLIGLLFTVLVFLILWDGYKATRGVVTSATGAGVFANQKLIETLGYVEALVMAFSICLAATGVVFLLKPGLATGQPGWMRRFAELGTLEKSLVRLAAMVLTIDVLTTALNPLSARQETLFRVLLYLCILIGLAFLSAFLLTDRQDDRSREDGRSLKEPPNGRDATQKPAAVQQ